MNNVILFESTDSTYYRVCLITSIEVIFLSGSDKKFLDWEYYYGVPLFWQIPTPVLFNRLTTHKK